MPSADRDFHLNPSQGQPQPMMPGTGYEALPRCIKEGAIVCWALCSRAFFLWTRLCLGFTRDCIFVWLFLLPCLASLPPLQALPKEYNSENHMYPNPFSSCPSREPTLRELYNPLCFFESPEVVCIFLTWTPEMTLSTLIATKKYSN